MDNEKQYTVEIKLDKKVVFTADVVARSEDQAKEFAYDFFEQLSYAEVKK